MRRPVLIVVASILLLAVPAAGAKRGGHRAAPAGAGWSGDMHLHAKGSYQTPTRSEQLDLQVDVNVVNDKAEFTGSFSHTTETTLATSKCSSPDKRDKKEGNGSGTGGGFIKSSVPAGQYDAVVGGIAFNVKHTYSYYKTGCSLQTSEKIEKFSVPIVAVTRQIGNMKREREVKGNITRDGCPLWATSKPGTCTTMISWSLSPSGCNQNLLRKALSQYQASDEFFDAADKQLKDSSDDFAKWKKEEALSFAEIGGEKASALSIINTLSVSAGAVAYAIAEPVGVVLTGQWIATDIIPSIHQHDKDLEQARRYADLGTATAKRAKVALYGDLVQQPACQAEAKQELANEQLRDQARAKIAEWEIEGGRNVYMNPTTHELLNEKAALAQALATLTAKRKTQALIRISGKPKVYLVTRQQLEKAVALLDRAIADQQSAMSKQDAVEKWNEQFRVRFEAILGRIKR
jgi:hypothetical protein